LEGFGTSSRRSRRGCPAGRAAGPALYIAASDCREVIAGLRIETPLHCAALQALVAIQSRIPQGVPPKQDPLSRVNPLGRLASIKLAGEGI
jgi:hypothetical protein